MQLYVQAVLGSDGFDKDVFDMEHFVVCHAAAHTFNHNTYHSQASQQQLRIHQARRFFVDKLFCSVNAKCKCTKHAHNNAPASCAQTVMMSLA